MPHHLATTDLSYEHWFGSHWLRPLSANALENAEYSFSLFKDKSQICLYFVNILPIIIQNNFKFETLIKDEQFTFNIFKIELYIKSRRNAKV